MGGLIKTIGALPFLVAVFLNTVVDLGHKIIIQNTIFKAYDGSDQVFLTAIVNGLILLPFILMFSTSGFLADKYPKSSVMRLAAWFAVAITIGITICYALGWFWVAFAMTFLLAVQSAVYSPAKYGYIKSLFGKQHLAEGNGLVQAISIIGILSGTVLFSILFEMWFPAGSTDKGQILRTLVPLGFILIVSSVFELIMMYRIPPLETTNEDHQFDWEAYRRGRMTLDNLKPVFNNQSILLSIIGLTVFWSIAQVLLAAFPAFVKSQTGETNTIIIQAILGASGIGIALGSLIAAKSSKNYIETGLVPVGAAGVAVGLFVLPTLSSHLLMGLDFLFIGLMGGMFIVPLNSLIQYHASENSLGRVLAANNLIQNIGMMLFLVVTVAFAVAGISSTSLLLLIAVVAVSGFAYTVYYLPQSLVKIILSYLMNVKYKVNVEGMKNIPATGGVLLLGNHISWIDWAIVQLASPRRVRFVMLKSIYERWYLNWFFRLFGSIPIEAGPSSTKALERVAELLNEGAVVCLFPEGTISRNGHLGEFKHGFRKAASLANEDVVIVPFYLRGLWGSKFSRSSEKLKSLTKNSQRRQLLVSFGTSLPIGTETETLKRRIFDLSITAWENYKQSLPTLADAWIESAKRVGSDMAIADTAARALSARDALVKSIMLSRQISKIDTGQNIGLLLPTSREAVLMNMAGLLSGKTLVNLNHQSGNDFFDQSIIKAQVKTVFTTQTFLNQLKDNGLDLTDSLNKIDVVFVESIISKSSQFSSSISWLAVKCLPSWALKKLFSKNHDAKQPAVISFVSDEKGNTNGVVLSHQNILINLKQVAEVLNAEGNDVIMASLPLYQVFGLTVTQFLPLIEGLPMVCHVDPNDGIGVGKAVARYNATILLGTSGFFDRYAKDEALQPLMFKSLRLVVSGVEPLTDEVQKDFKLKFSKTILEGYGATETAPVASVNLPDVLDTSYWKVQLGSKQGTVGMPLPGASFKVIDADSLEELPIGEHGMILIGGPQVMLGYLNDPVKTAQAIYEADGIRWFVSGDIGYLDEDGFLTVTQQYSRFNA